MEPASGRYLRHLPIPLEAAREAIAAVQARGFSLNVYVDDELYVERLTPEAERYATFQNLPVTPVGPVLDWLEEAPTKLVTIGDPGELDRLEVELKRELGERLFIAKSLPDFLEFADAGVTKGSASRSWRHARRSRQSARSRSATARTTSSCSRRRATRSRSPTPTRRLLAVADRLCPPPRRRASRRCSRRCSRPEVVGAVSRLYTPMIDIRAARNDPDAWRAALARKGAAEAFDALRRRRPRLARARAAGRRVALEDEAEGKADAGAGRGAEGGEGGAGTGRGGAGGRRRPPRRAARARCRTRPSRPPRTAARTTRSSCAASASRPRSRSSRSDHLELARIDMERGARLSGSRFAYRMGDVRPRGARPLPLRARPARRARLRRPCCRPCSFARRRCTGRASCRRTR